MDTRAVLLVVAGSLAWTPASAADDLRAITAPPAGVTRVYLVRHAQAKSNLDPRPSLPEDQLNELTDLGRRQAVAAARALSNLGIGSVRTSPAGRARNTATILTEALGLGAAVPEDRLRPLELGRAPDGRKLGWTERESLLKAGEDSRPDGGESLEDVSLRVDRLVRDIARQDLGRGVVLVSHGEVVASWLGRVRGVPPWKRYPPGLANGALAVVDVGRNGKAAIRLDSFLPPAP